MAKVIDDYKDFVGRMTDAAVESIDKIKESGDEINDKRLKNDLNEYCNVKIREVDAILGGRTRTTKRKGEERRYWHLLKHRFDLNEKIKIQREDDSDTISDKIFDFSYDTIDQLIKKGSDDALEMIFEVEKEKNKNNVNNVCNELQKLIQDIEEQNTNQDQYLMEAAKNIIKINQ